MFSKKFSSNIRLKRRMIRSTIILLVVCLGLGYSAFTTNLGINGTLNVSKYDQTLYGVLEKAAKKGTYAKEYTGEHHDSFTVEPTRKIYHWYAPSTTAGDTLATEILDKNNVIFANHCWQMIRTTDTGGVKMIYNGEAENNQCLNTRGTHVGYESRTTQSMSTTYYYGTSYTYDKTNNVFSLDGTVTTGTIQLGQYTCKKTTSTGTCETLYLVDTLSRGTTYYVLPLNSNSHYSQIGKLQFNQSNESLAYVGYMYNTVYLQYRKSHTYNFPIDNVLIDTNDYYSDSIDYGNNTPNQYTLTNPQLISTLSDNSQLVGKYIVSNGGNGSATEAKYVVRVDGTRIYYKKLIGGDLTVSIVVGESYTDNGNNTYTINNPISIKYDDWYSNEYQNHRHKYTCSDTDKMTCTNIRYITLSNSGNYSYWGVEHTYKYSENINYNGETYTLSGDVKELWDLSKRENLEILFTHHYTCFENGNVCSTINYVSNVTSYIYHIPFSGVSNISDVLTNMLSADNVNQNNSIIKTGIDAWYKMYMTDYTNKLEDTVFCSDRVIKRLGGYKPNGGPAIYDVSVNSTLQFNNNYEGINGNLECQNNTDRFSMQNSKAKLTYPVGLISRPEIDNFNNRKIAETRTQYWLISPYEFRENMVVNFRDSGGYQGYGYGSFGVRPAISLKPGTEYVSGTGSMADPYVVE